MRRIAFYGGTFDPPHIGHLAIAETLLREFALDEFVFIPAFHAPHKSRLKPTSAYDRFAMLCLATEQFPNITVSKIEIERAEKAFTVDTLTSLKAQFPADKIFFVMGADSWMDIRTWREWEKVLLMTDHIVVTRPGIEISTDHVSRSVRDRIVDLRDTARPIPDNNGPHIYLTNSVEVDVSATRIRHTIRNGESEWISQVPASVANYIEKYQIYS